jgi:hypothetical protein
MSVENIDVTYNYYATQGFIDRMYLSDENHNVIYLEIDDNYMGISVSDAEIIIKKLQSQVDHFKNLKKA